MGVKSIDYLWELARDTDVCDNIQVLIKSDVILSGFVCVVDSNTVSSAYTHITRKIQ